MEPDSPPSLPRDHPLAGCEQKLRRAHKHFELLQREIKKLGPRKFQPATFRTEQKPNAENTFWTYVESVNPPPPHLGPIIGDIAHNLRSTLDHLVFELAFLGVRGRYIPERTGFPVCRTRSQWNDGYVQALLLKGVMQKHRAMLYRLQPCYRRQDNPSPTALRRRRPGALTDLHDLWNEDKHRLVQTTGIAPTRIRPSFRVRRCVAVGDPRINRAFLGQPLKPGTEVVTIRIRPTGEDPQVDVNFQASGEICLANGLPVRKALAEIGDWVTAVIAHFEPAFETPSARRLWGLPRGSWVEREPLRKPRVEIGRWTVAAAHATPPTG